jgi:hypothetical protein
MKVTTEDIIKELHRELKMRERVYPRQISEGKMHRHQANKRYLCIQRAIEIIEDKELKKTGVQKELF